jgi:hypothetical protein
MMVVPCQTGMALERWSFMARHMGANGLLRKHSCAWRWIVVFSGRNYGNPFRNQLRLIDFVQSSTDHEGRRMEEIHMSLKARAQEKVERAGISNYSFDHDVLVMCGVRYTIAACNCGQPDCDGVRLERNAAIGGSRVLQ